MASRAFRPPRDLNPRPITVHSVIDLALDSQESCVSGNSWIILRSSDMPDRDRAEAVLSARRPGWQPCRCPSCLFLRLPGWSLLTLTRPRRLRGRVFARIDRVLRVAGAADPGRQVLQVPRREEAVEWPAARQSRGACSRGATAGRRWLRASRMRACWSRPSLKPTPS